MQAKKVSSFGLSYLSNGKKRYQPRAGGVEKRKCIGCMDFPLCFIDCVASKSYFSCFQSPATLPVENSAGTSGLYLYIRLEETELYPKCRAPRGLPWTCIITIPKVANNFNPGF